MPSCQIEQHNENSSENGIAIPDSIMWGHHDFQNNDTKMEIAGSNDDQPMVGYGYTNKSIASYKTKIRYNSTSPVVIGAGLPGGIYFVEIIKDTKTLYSTIHWKIILSHQKKQNQRSPLTGKEP